MAKCDSFSSRAKNKITVKRPVTVDSAMGGQTVTFETLGAYWAIIEPKSGREFFAQGSLQSLVSHTAIIRYKSDFSNITNISNYVIEFNGRTFTVISIHNLDSDMKTEGSDFQKLYLEENGADKIG